MQGLAAAALVAAPLVAAANFNITGNDILNFALNLECLEAEFYSWAAYGKSLSDELLGGGPASVGGMRAKLSPTVDVRLHCSVRRVDQKRLCTALM
jgi:hypothetical protein